MMIEQALPSLAVGSHERGSGKACVMNYISYVNGDKIITDYPDCTHRLLARAAQVVNDKICTHRAGDVLCSDCSGVMLGLGARLIGTAQPDLTEGEAHRLNMRLAVWCAKYVQHLVGGNAVGPATAAIEAAEKWLADPTRANAAAGTAAGAAAYAAAYAAGAVSAAYAAAAAGTAAYAAAYAAGAVSAAYAAAAAGTAANAAAYAAGAVSAAYAADAAGAVSAAYAADAAGAAAYAATFLTRLLDYFDELTGHTPTPEPDWTSVQDQVMAGV